MAYLGFEKHPKTQILKEVTFIAYYYLEWADSCFLGDWVQRLEMQFYRMHGCVVGVFPVRTITYKPSLQEGKGRINSRNYLVGCTKGVSAA